MALALLHPAGLGAQPLALLQQSDAARCRVAVTPEGGTSLVGVRWMPPSIGKDTAILRAWCTTTGPPVVAGVPERPHDDPSTESLDELVVVSWNVHVGAADVETLVRRLRAGDFTDGRPTPRFVLLLQEALRRSDVVPRVAAPGVRIPDAIGSGATRQDVVGQAARLGLALHYVPSMRNGTLQAPSEDRGNAILSTEPLRDLTAIELPFGRQRRVAVSASIALRHPDGHVQSLRLTSVHLEVAGPARHLWLFGRLRQRQVRAVTDTLPQAAPLVIGGDFNTWFGFTDSAYRAMARVVPDIGALDRRPTFGWLRLDHLFSRPPTGWSAVARRLDDRFGSDHFPILARMRAVTHTSARDGNGPAHGHAVAP